MGALHDLEAVNILVEIICMMHRNATLLLLNLGKTIWLANAMEGGVDG